MIWRWFGSWGSDKILHYAVEESARSCERVFTSKCGDFGVGCERVVHFPLTTFLHGVIILSSNESEISSSQEES